MLWEKEFSHLINGALISTQKQISRKIERIQNELNTVNARFWQLFAAKTIGAESTPAYAAEDGRKWVPLKKKYAKAKGHARFYEKYGTLSTYIRSLTFKGTFGSPQVVPKYEARGTVEGEEVEFFRRGKLHTATRNVKTGAFMTKDEMRKLIPVGITIIEYPKVRRAVGEEFDDIEDVIFGEGSIASLKFQNPKMKKLRPAVGPYLKWWSKNVMRGVLSKYGKVQ